MPPALPADNRKNPLSGIYGSGTKVGDIERELSRTGFPLNPKPSTLLYNNVYLWVFENFLKKKVCEKFGGYAESVYLCTRF